MPIENRGIDEELFKMLTIRFGESRSLKWFGIRLKYLAPGRTGAEVTIVPDHANSSGIAHGGFTTALVDTAMGISIFTLNHRVVTLEMNLNYLAPAKVGETLTADAWVIHQGSNTVVTEAEVYNDRKALLAKSRGTFFIIGQKKA